MGRAVNIAWVNIAWVWRAGTHDALSDALVARDRVVRVQHLPDEVLLQDTGLWFSIYAFASGYRISEINPLYKMSILEIRSSPVIALSASKTCPNTFVLQDT